MNETAIALISIGVVYGEYGMAEAYAKKAAEIEHWLSDSDENVRDFAKSHIESLLLTEQLERESNGRNRASQTSIRRER